MNKWIAEFDLEDGDTMPEHMDLEYKGARIDFHCRPLEQEPTTKNNLGVDCISRTRAIERLKLNFPISQGADNSRDRHRYMQALADLQAIKELPSVIPIRPKGHWIDKQHLFGSCSAECSSCHKRSDGFVKDSGFSLEYKYYDFCPNCGAKMDEPRESEEKMGMTLEEAIKYYENKNVVLTEEEALANTIALNTMRKYQMFQADYENRLKADMKAMLTELQLEIEEMDSGCGWEGYRPTAQVIGLIQQKINELKADQEGEK